MDLFNLKGNFGNILALLMCFSVISCGSDGENVEPGAQNVPQGKRLVSILTDGIYEYPSIKYDSYGRVSQIEETYYAGSRQNPIYGIQTYLYNFNYKADTLIVVKVRKSGEMKTSLTYKYVLNSRGFISKLHSGKEYSTSSEYEFGWQFEYDDNGSLVNFKGVEITNAKGYEVLRKFICSDGNVINTTLPDFTYRNYVYSNYENKANIVLNDIMYAPHNLAGQIQDYTFDSIIRYGIPTVLYHAGLLGKANKNLVLNSIFNNKQKSSFTYAFDSDGYPTYIEVTTKKASSNDLVMHFFLAYE